MSTHATKSRSRALTLGLLATLLALAAGCPLQTPSYAVDELQITTSSTSPTVGQSLTLEAAINADAGGGGAVDLTAATWSTSDTTIISLGSASGRSVTAQANMAGTATISVVAGAASSSLTLTVAGP